MKIRHPMRLHHVMPGYFLGEIAALLVGCVSLRETAAQCNTHSATRTRIRRRRDYCTLQHTPCNTHHTPRAEIHRQTDCDTHPERHAHYTTHRNTTMERLQHTAIYALQQNPRTTHTGIRRRRARQLLDGLTGALVSITSLAICVVLLVVRLLLVRGGTCEKFSKLSSTLMFNRQF